MVLPAQAGLRFLSPLKSSSFTPAQLPGINQFFNAPDITGLSNNDPISTWPKGLVSGGDNATSSSTNRPLFQTSSLNGRPGVLFDGTDDYFTFGTANNAAQGSAGYVFFVIDATAGAGTYYESLFGLKTATTNSGLMLFLTNDAGFSDFTFGFSGSPAVVGMKTTGDFNTSAAFGLIQYNGGTVTSTGSWSFIRNSASPSTLSTTAGNLGVGTSNVLGNYPGTLPSIGFYYKGLMYSFGSGTGTLSAGDISNLRAWVLAIWGVS